MSNGWTRAGAATGVLVLAALGWGCGNDPREGLSTVRSMTPSEGPADTGPDIELPDLDAPDAEPATTRTVNQAPRIRAMQVDPAPRIPAGTDVKVVVDAVDPEGDELELDFTWFVNQDEIDHEGPVFQTGALGRGDTVRVEAVASDGRADSAPMSSPVLTVANGLPRIVSRPEPAGPDGVFRYQLEVQDAEGEGPLRFSLARSPRGMTVNPVRGLVEWRPGRDQAGTHPVEILVEDSAGGVVHQSFELTIDAPPAAPAR